MWILYRVSQNVYELNVAKDPDIARVGPLEPWDLHYLIEIATAALSTLSILRKCDGVLSDRPAFLEIAQETRVQKILGLELANLRIF